jgi:hypothetical protein
MNFESCYSSHVCANSFMIYFIVYSGTDYHDAQVSPYFNVYDYFMLFIYSTIV